MNCKKNLKNHHDITSDTCFFTLYSFFFYTMSNISQDHSRPSSPEEQPSSKKAKNSRKKRSWIWEYFEVVDVNEQTNDKGEQLKRCKVLDSEGIKCGAVYANDGSTGNAINHLLSKHEMTKEGKINNVSNFLNLIIISIHLNLKIN